MSRSVLVALSVWLALGCGSSPSPAPAPPPQPAPEPGGNPTTAPPSPPPATPPPAPETFVTVERLDSDPECDELVPTSIPVPVKVHIADQTPFCGRGISEGHGNVALSHETQDVVEWSLFSPSGTAGRVLTQ